MKKLENSVKETFIKLVKNNSESLASQFGVRRLGLFGSCARGQEIEDSDVDVLVEFDVKTFDNYMELKFFLESEFGRSVDLVIYEALKAELRNEILSEVTYAA